MTHTCSECGRSWPDDKLNNYQNHIYGSHNLDTANYLERYKRIRREIPAKYRDVYDDLTGKGKSPKAVQAAICYIESEVTQSVAADAFGVTAFAVRTHTRELVRRGVVSLEYVRENSPREGRGQFNGMDGKHAGGEVRNGV